MSADYRPKGIWNHIPANVAGSKALAIFKKANDGISPTQRTAIDNGTTSKFEQSILAGAPDFAGLLAMPRLTLTEREQAFIDNETETLCSLTDDWKIRQSKTIQPEVWKYAGDNGFFGLAIPEEYGGKGFSSYARFTILSKIASRSPTVGAAVMVPNSLAGGELIVHFGTPEQKEYLLPRLATGKEMGCFALTSLIAGSDATSVKDKAFLERDKDTGELRLRIQLDKRYSTNAPIATIAELAVRFYDPENILGGGVDRGITVLVAPPKGGQGLNIGHRHYPFSSPFWNGPLWADGATVPFERNVEGKKIHTVLGGEAGIGMGWPMLTFALTVGRGESLPASSVGMAEKTTRLAGAYAAIREQFGRPLKDMEGIQEVLARIAANTYMIRATATMPLMDIDLADPPGSAHPAVGTTVSKYYCTETARKVVTDGMDVHGGKGVMDGPNNMMAAMYGAIPVGITVEGHNVMGVNLMITGQAAIMAHPYVLDEINLARDAKEGKITARDARKDALPLGYSHAKYIFNTGSQAISLGHDKAAHFTPPRDGPDAPYYRQVARMAAAFAYSLNVSMGLLNKDLQARQLTASRYAKIYTDIYASSAVLRQWDSEGRNPAEFPLVEYCVSACMRHAEETFEDLIRNHPRPLTKEEKQEKERLLDEDDCSLAPETYEIPVSKLAQRLIRGAVFPDGRKCQGPSDNTIRAIAALVSTPGPVRDTLTRSVYLPTDPKEPLFRQEEAFLLVPAARKINKKIARAIKDGTIPGDPDPAIVVKQAEDAGAIDGKEAQHLRDLYTAMLDVCQVDIFDKDLNGPSMLRYPTLAQSRLSR